MDYLSRLAAFVCETSFADLGHAAVAATKNVVLDTLGAILAGSRLPENACLARLAAERSGKSTATVIGHPLRADPMLATLANGTAGVSLEVDEGNRWGGGHPAVHVLPAALAVAEELSAPPRRFLEAVVAGYEIASRLGGATQLRPNVHPHGTWGTIAAAVATARLLGYDATGVREVANLAASMSPANSWTPCLEGATIRNLYPGRSGLQGLLAVHLHRCGYTGIADGPADIFGTIVGHAFDPDAVLQGLGTPYRIQRNYFKFHACCLYNHPTLDALAAIAAGAPFTAEQVAGIEVTTIPLAERMTDPAPTTMLGAKFSIPYAAAAALVLGRTDLSAFEREAIEDPRVRELAARVTVRVDPLMSIRDSQRPMSRVTVTLKDGRSFSREATTVRGDAENPAPRSQLVDKFLSLAGPVLGEAGARAVVDAVDQLEDLGEIGALTRLLG